eukprot:3790306-Rhodomonas_salina.1
MGHPLRSKTDNSFLEVASLGYWILIAVAYGVLAIVVPGEPFSGCKEASSSEEYHPTFIRIEALHFCIYGSIVLAILEIAGRVAGLAVEIEATQVLDLFKSNGIPWVAFDLGASFFYLAAWTSSLTGFIVTPIACVENALTPWSRTGQLYRDSSHRHRRASNHCLVCSCPSRFDAFLLLAYLCAGAVSARLWVSAIGAVLLYRGLRAAVRLLRSGVMMPALAGCSWDSLKIFRRISRNSSSRRSSGLVTSSSHSAGRINHTKGLTKQGGLDD